MGSSGTNARKNGESGIEMRGNFELGVSLVPLLAYKPANHLGLFTFLPGEG
jgi:hypothetical protein